jgi:hypothetical protein
VLIKTLTRASAAKDFLLRLFRSLLTCLLALAVSGLPALGRSKGSPPLDPDYVLALATANDFLHAWQTQDQETGILLLTDRLKQRTPENALDSFFSPNGCKRQSFEIGHGKRLGAGRYQFPVSLFQRPAQTAPKKNTLGWTHPQTSALVVVKTGKNDWAIDKLP